jgi:hypothetical protein
MSEIEWIKLPQDLQHKFFEIAESESKKAAETIERLQKELKGLTELVSKHSRKFETGEERFRVAAVDSSKSPRMSQRLGIRYGVFSVGVTYLDKEGKKDEFEAGIFKRKQALAQEESEFMFDIQTVFEERKVAKKALENSDFVIIDGTFYGFLYTALKMMEQGYYQQHHKDVVERTYELTNELVESRRVIGVIKRSRTRALGGYMFLKAKNSTFVSVIDKLILSMILGKDTLFEYKDILGEKPVPLYSQIAALVNRGKKVDDYVEESRIKTYRPFEKLSLDSSRYNELRRIQVRAFEHMPPCEIEFPDKMQKDVMLLISQNKFFNEGTNLPMALDLVDSSVNLSAGFADEFTDEVQSRLIEMFDRENKNKDIARFFFSLMNPQKEF